MAETKAKSKPKRSSKASKSKSSSSKASSATKEAPSSSNGNAAGSTVKDAAQKAALPLLATGAALAGAVVVIVGKNGHKQRKVLGVPMPKKKGHLPHVSMPKVGLPKGKGLKGDVRRVAGAVTDAAEKADLIGKRISRVAHSVQEVGEATDDAAKKT
ncbi:MAG TPA: hypothetical protein VGI17_14005 [Solirubrobacterales bacterium]|jgi:hypothetical protein